MHESLWTASKQGDAGITVNVSSQTALLSELGAELEQGAGFSVATLNLDHVVKLRTDETFRAAYSQHTHVTADGRPIVWLSRWAGDEVELVTGSDLLDPMIALCAQQSVPVAFFGSTEAVLQTATQRLRARHPDLTVAAAIAPPMGFDPQSKEADAYLDQMAQSGARVCFLALGAPKQEVLAARGLKSHPQIGFLSIGASLDFVAGSQVRAPRIFRALALEWLWRLLRDPGRMASRYGACAALLPRLLVRATSARRQSTHAPTSGQSGNS